MNGRHVCATALLAAMALLNPFAAGAQDHQAAIWNTHELDFQYMGFTSRFSCSGLQDQIHEILLNLGARDDRDMVGPGACSGVGDRPSRIAGVHIKMATLQPAVNAGQAAAVDAYWKPVIIGGGSDVDCELIQQVKTDILPLFTTRNVNGPNIECVPHQATRISAKLRLEVLTVAVPAR